MRNPFRKRTIERPEEKERADTARADTAATSAAPTAPRTFCPRCGSGEPDRMIAHRTAPDAPLGGCHPRDFEDYHLSGFVASATSATIPADDRMLAGAAPRVPQPFRCNMPGCDVDHDMTAILSPLIDAMPVDRRAILRTVAARMAECIRADPAIVPLGMAIAKLGIPPGDPLMIAWGAVPFTRFERSAEGRYTIVVETPGLPVVRKPMNESGPPPPHVRADAARAYAALDPRLQFEVTARVLRAGLPLDEWGITEGSALTC